MRVEVRFSEGKAALLIMTITGHSLDEIFERIEGRVSNQVPMS